MTREAREWMISPVIEYDKKARWEPIAWRLVRAGERYRYIFDGVSKAAENWDGGHPQVRAPWAEPDAVEIVGHKGYSAEFHDQYLREFTLSASEAIHHIRSALDYVIYQLVIEDAGRSQTGTQFVIASDPDGFANQASKKMRGISRAHRNLVERVQPFNGVAWAKQLNLLSNRDKHRTPIDVIPSYQFKIDETTPYSDPLGDPGYRGFQIEHAELSFRFSGTEGEDSAALEVTETLLSILTGAIEFVNYLFPKFGLNPIEVVTDDKQ